MNRICALYCIWGDANDLIEHSIRNILPLVDGVIVAFSNTSNFGHHKQVWMSGVDVADNPKVMFYQFEPKGINPHEREINKRNFALDKAKQAGYSHFIMLDFDEFYEPSEFKAEWERIQNNNLSGSVCRTRVYFRKPTYYLPDHTLVPFIHKITPSLQFQLNSKTYPFAYDSGGNAHIDPTRRLNISSGVEWSDVTMHHFSWYRSDYNLKIENSAARNNLKRSSIYRDLENAAPGVYNEFYRAEIKECENIFNLPEL